MGPFLALKDGLLFVVVNGQQVLVVDVTDPGRPRGDGSCRYRQAIPGPMSGWRWAMR